MFYNKLMHIRADLKQHHRPKQILMKIYIQERLNKSLKTYYDELSRSATYLENRKPDNVIKKM